MAERRQRGDKADDGRRVDATASESPAEDEVVEDEAQGDDYVSDESDDDVLADEVDEDDEDDESASDKSVKTKSEATGSGNRKSEKAKPAKAKSDRPGIFARFVNFVREVVAELRKVIWPTRSELLTYTAVVVLFVTMMFTIVGLLDFGFAKGVLWVFGNKASGAE